MPIPSSSDFADAMRAHAADHIPPEQLGELTEQLLTAYEAVREYRPFSVRAVNAPWGGSALAFEASWADTHVLIVAVRLPPAQGSPAQLTLRRAGQLEYAVSATAEHLGAAVALCLSRHIKHPEEGHVAAAPGADHPESTEPAASHG